MSWVMPAVLLVVSSPNKGGVSTRLVKCLKKCRTAYDEQACIQECVDEDSKPRNKTN